MRFQAALADLEKLMAIVEPLAEGCYGNGQSAASISMEVLGMDDPIGEWEKANPLRKWLDSGAGDGYDVTNATGMPRERQEELMQGRAVPTDQELKDLSDLLGDPKLAEAWKEWRNSDPGVQTGAAAT